MSQVTSTPHPVKLVNITFPKAKFVRTKKLDPKMALYFPAFALTTERILDSAERTLVLVMKVKSTSHRKAVLSFDFEAEAVFQCAEFERTEEALEQFASGTTPMMLAWAYVRSYMALQMTQLGLPPYHLPLVLRWNEAPDAPTEVEATPPEGQ